MRQRLLLLLVRNGYSPTVAADIVGVLLKDPFLGQLLSGEPPQEGNAGLWMQHLPGGVLYFVPYHNPAS